MPATASPKKSKRDVIAALRQPKVAVMLLLGFSSGLPFLLTGNTLGYWLRDEGTTLQAIGFLSWVGLAYSVKFLWAPVIDRVDAPVFGRLGRRRGWMVVSQLLVAAGLLGLSVIGLGAGLGVVGGLAIVVAFASSTQDIVVDAWRIEAANDSDELGLLSAAYQLGYRGALLVTDSLILISASRLGWPISYSAMAVLMGIGIFASFVALEPLRATAVVASRTDESGSQRRGFFDAVIGPFVEFFRVYGWLAVLMLAVISFYRLPEFMMGPMANPFYHDLGLSKDAVGAVRASIGLPASLLGIAAGGFSALRFGYFRTLIVGVILQSVVISAFALLAYRGPDLQTFGAVMAADNFGISFAGVALVTYMSSLTSLGYTATQYALLSSAYAYIGKFAKGFSGVLVEHLAAGRTLTEGYALFFIGAGLLGIPALVLCLLLSRATRDREQRT
jgi:MFS transporter, PAT family, beta-lactamase induction signal transducer AmpG